ncbi:MAG: aminopeptidase N [Arcobacter sp.]|nr:MAG: aminopeptidase N [Arcobacter sp.]
MNNMEKIYLADYEKPAFEIKTIDLEFNLDDTKTLVKSKMQVKHVSKVDSSFFLNGEELELVYISLDGRELHESEYELNELGLTLHKLADDFSLEIHNIINPQDNTALDGLYKSSGIFCSQNEPEGFRRITYFTDRPDVMAVYTTKIIADKKDYPILLSNGNLFEKGNLDKGKHYAIWKDPFPKPSYLYALVAGSLGCVNDSFTTMNKNEIELNIYCDKGNEAQCSHAMTSLKNSMKWDEERFGREYDLEIYNIVAVDSFNMGAMENKGLNVFNSHYVLADANTATDANFMGIESVIGHEYFHNWTGNRITCRDWFQLTLKEGLTVFRDQEFSADLNTRTVQRIEDVKALRERQFVEDASPTAHPIKPDAYIQINNFYTATIYEKGAEVIRMIHTLIGEKGFRAGMDLYFKTFDGQAVRTEDFIWSMQEASGFNLEHFKLWYAQSGTPEVDIKTMFDKKTKTLSMTLTQSFLSPTQTNQKPYFFPFKIALINASGHECKLELEDNDGQSLINKSILLVSKEEEIFVFKNIKEAPIMSLNRNFTAPVKVHTAYSLEEYAFLMAHDKDEFNRFEASQTLASMVLHKLIDAIEANAAMSLSDVYSEAFLKVLLDMDMDMSLKADSLSLPSVSMLMQDRKILDIEAIYAARNFLKRELIREHGADITSQYSSLNTNCEYSLENKEMARRKLKNTLLAYMGALKDEKPVLSQYKNANNMTDRLAALSILANSRGKGKLETLADFYKTYKDNTLVMNKYLAVIASSQLKETPSNVIRLLNDEVFDIKVPNLVRSLIGSYARNALHFHAVDGSGYEFIADKVLELDKLNPQIASGLSGVYKDYGRLNEKARGLMKAQLEKIINTKELSKNVYEIVSKILG